MSHSTTSGGIRRVRSRHASGANVPAAPVALGKADDDVSNLITYQSALAVHAKRDEQLRTIGALVAKFLA